MNELLRVYAKACFEPLNLSPKLGDLIRPTPRLVLQAPRYVSSRVYPIKNRRDERIVVDNRVIRVKAHS